MESKKGSIPVQTQKINWVKSIMLQFGTYNSIALFGLSFYSTSLTLHPTQR